MPRRTGSGRAPAPSTASRNARPGIRHSSPVGVGGDGGRARPALDDADLTEPLAGSHHPQRARRRGPHRERARADDEQIVGRVALGDHHATGGDRLDVSAAATASIAGRSAPSSSPSGASASAVERRRGPGRRRCAHSGAAHRRRGRRRRRARRRPRRRRRSTRRRRRAGARSATRGAGRRRRASPARRNASARRSRASRCSSVSASTSKTITPTPSTPSTTSASAGEEITPSSISGAPWATAQPISHGPGAREAATRPDSGAATRPPMPIAAVITPTNSVGRPSRSPATRRWSTPSAPKAKHVSVTSAVSVGDPGVGAGHASRGSRRCGGRLGQRSSSAAAPPPRSPGAATRRRRRRTSRR